MYSKYGKTERLRRGDELESVGVRCRQGLLDAVQLVENVIVNRVIGEVVFIPSIHERRVHQERAHHRLRLYVFTPLTQVHHARARRLELSAPWLQPDLLLTPDC